MNTWHHAVNQKQFASHRSAHVLALSALLVLCSSRVDAQPKSPGQSKVETAASNPQSPCERSEPRGCLALALEAMGGQSRLEAVKSFAFEAVGHTALVEQSYRQDPFITSYERTKGSVDLIGGRIHLDSHLTWPESDPGQAELDSTLVIGPGAA